MQPFPLFGQDNASQHDRTRNMNGPWRSSVRGRWDFDAQSVQTNDAVSKFGNGRQSGFSTAYLDSICHIQVHIETMINRFHDLYERRGRIAEARRLSEMSIDSLLQGYDEDRVPAALHLLTETYQRCELPQAGEAYRTLMDWWEYLLHHRHPTRTPNKGETAYELRKAQSAKNAAMDLWRNYNMLLEDKNRWLDTYIAETTAKERDIHMKLQIQALNAVDKELAVESNLHYNNIWFDNKPNIPKRRRRAPVSNMNSEFRTTSRADKIDFDKMGHFEARQAEKNRVKEIFNQYRPVTQVMGETSADHQKTIAVIDTGDEGPNVISLQFLTKLKLDHIVETTWSGDEQEITDASGNTFKPIGWLELYFKFEKLPGGWHSSLFWVADVINYDLIIGMPCLMQENIKSKVIAPLVPNQAAKRSKEKSQAPESREDQERRDRAERRRLENRNSDSALAKKWQPTPIGSNLGLLSADRSFSALQPTVEDVNDDVSFPLIPSSSTSGQLPPLTKTETKSTDWAEDEDDDDTFGNSGGLVHHGREDSGDLSMETVSGGETYAGKGKGVAAFERPGHFLPPRQDDDSWTKVVQKKKGRTGGGIALQSPISWKGNGKERKGQERGEAAGQGG